MPGKHKEPTIAFRPSAWERAVIEQRAALSGMYKKDFIIRSCIYSKVIVVGKKENVQRILDKLQEVQIIMQEIAGQMQTDGFFLSEESYQELKQDYLAFIMTVVDILNGAAYLFEKESATDQTDQRRKIKLEQCQNMLGNKESRKR